MSEEMNGDSREVHSKVRYGRFLSLSRTIALGSSVSLGLGVFVLLGLALDAAGTRTPLSYGLTAIVFLPLILAYAERALAIPTGEGVFRLGRSDEPSWLAYADDWLAYCGFAGLIGLLGWGVAFHLNQLLVRLFDISVGEAYLAIAVILLVAINRAFGRQGTWRTRMRFVYISVPLLFVIIGIGWVSAGQMPSLRFVLRMPGDIVLAVALLAGMLWGTGLILDQRDQVRRPVRNLLPALYLALLIGSITGLLAAMMVLKYPGIGIGVRLPLAVIASQTSSFLEMVYLSLGILICIIALDRIFISSLRTVGAMMAQGFIPTQGRIGKKFKVNVNRLFLITLLSVIILLVVSFELLVSLIGLIFLLMTILVFSRDLVKPRASLPDHRGLKMPFHPLVPALAVVVSLYFSIAYDLQIWMVVMGWGMLGLIFYLAYARRGSLAVRKQTQIMGEEIPRYAEKDFRILVDVTSAKDELSLIRAGITMAQSGDGQVLIMQVLDQIQHMPVETEHRTAEKALLVLKNKVHQIENDGVPIETLVRLAPSRASGILETVREENIDLVLIGWSGPKQQGEEMLDADINRLIQTAPCDVAVLRGELAGPIRSVTVSTRGGPHAGEALRYGKWLVEQQDGQVVALNIVRGALTAEKRAQAEQQLNQAINDAGEKEAYLPRVVMAGDVKAGILKESVDSDLLLMGVSTHGLLDQAVLDGIPVEVARARTGATLLVKHHEGTRDFWLRRAWEMIYSFFPTLTVGERTEVDRRIKRSAMASVDFYALITLSAVIAVLGLIQDSGAVIIGAMLVAPLMSPILAMAFSLVLGDVRMLAQSGESTLKGILLAIVVAVVIALVIPPLPISAQILARTQPNLLDLIVALASGAAAAYALARKHLAAALPGVAIAAALVPPLCVVGYGLGYGMYGVAGGALLLFATNLSAIVLSAATVFLLLGFRPDRAEYGQRIQRWILLTVAVLLVIATPLAFATINLRSNLDRQQEVKSVLNEVIQAEFAEVEDVTIKQQGDGYLISGTVYSYGEITDEELAEVQTLLSEEIGAPVIIRARIINAKLRVVGGEKELDVISSP